jgi:hypothetical protein
MKLGESVLSGAKVPATVPQTEEQYNEGLGFKEATILYGTASGNAEKHAKLLQKNLVNGVRYVTLYSYKFQEIYLYNCWT